MSIKVIMAPSVHLVGRTEVDEAGLQRFLESNDIASWSTDTEVGGERLIEVAGRCCYWSFARPRPGGNAAYIAHILDVAHGSVLEHSVFNLIFTGVSRSLTHELVRHRAGFGFSQLSQRYVDESDTEFVVPDLFRDEVAASREYVRCKGGDLTMATLHIREDYEDEPETRDAILVGLAWLKCVEHCRFTYGFLAERGEAKLSRMSGTARRKAAREAARSVLPNATETKIFVTANVRALRHFIELRADPAADAEIRRLALEVLRVLRDAAPNLFGDYDAAGSTPHRKV